jgi:hypothetical protein
VDFILILLLVVAAVFGGIAMHARFRRSGPRRQCDVLPNKRSRESTILASRKTAPKRHKLILGVLGLAAFFALLAWPVTSWIAP